MQVFARAYAASLPDACLEIIAGGAHYPYLEMTQAFIDVVETFLAVTP